MGLSDAFGKVKDIVQGKSMTDIAIEHVGDQVDKATGGKFTSHIDKAEEFAKDAANKVQEFTKDK